MPILPFAFPRQGLVLAYGSILDGGSLWYLIDLERAEATRIRVNAHRVTGKQSVVERVSRPLLISEVSELTQLANRVWSTRDGLASKMGTDVVWDLWLLDGDEVRHESAAGTPEGITEEVAQFLFGLIGQEVSVRSGATP